MATRGQQDLDRDLAIQLRIAGAVDLAHPTHADALQDLIGAYALALEALSRGVDGKHGRRLQEAHRLLVRREQLYGRFEQRLVALARRGQVGGAGLQPQRPRPFEHLLEARPGFGREAHADNR